MTLYRAIRSELVKLRHTPLLPIHIFVPIVGAILFTSYFGLYSFRPDYNKYKLIFEITATFFPILISIITGLNTFVGKIRVYRISTVMKAVYLEQISYSLKIKQAVPTIRNRIPTTKCDHK